MDIKHFLEVKNLTQKEFAEKLGVTQGRIAQWIAGDEFPLDRITHIEAVTDGLVTRYDLRPDFPWDRVASNSESRESVA